jgi:hypothetical protein
MRFLNKLVSMLACAALCACAHAAAADAAGSPFSPALCLADVEDAAAFLTANDAGAADALADHGPAIRAAFDKARAEAAQVSTVSECGKLLTTYVHAWRPDHIGVRPVQNQPAAAVKAVAAAAVPDPRAPRFQVLGKDTVLLVFPTFNDAQAPAVRKLVAEQRAALASHRNWILDVRGNGGGSDSTYAPLLGWILDGDLRGYGTEYLATPANIAAQEAVCADTSDPAGCNARLGPIIERMRAAPSGSFVLDGPTRIEMTAVKLEARRPARVAVLADGHCGSSCEQFVLEARTGFRVKIVGRPTVGVLDISNVRRHPLPSGRILLSYATTRTTRLPDMRIDGVGIAPDVLLPAPADAAARAAEVVQVQRWLETGRL